MKHLVVLFMWFLFSVTAVQCKAVFRLKIHRVVVAKCNKEYLDIRVWISKPNRYTNALNGELSKYKFPPDAKVLMTLANFALGPIFLIADNCIIERDVCHFISLEYKMMIYPDLFKSGAHMPEPKCPIQLGNYSYANFTPDAESYPATLPFHNFMLEIIFRHGKVEIAVQQFYGILDRDAVIREQYS